MSLSGISQITIVSEADIGWLDELGAEMAVGARLVRIPAATRPDFGALIARANAELAGGARAVCICNADISLGSQADAKAIIDLLNHLEDGSPGPAVLALTRHESETGVPVLDLYQGENGLPNTISADLWAFARPLSVARELFYCPGQMNCDMLLAHDLITTGHRLFNPCLDVFIMHHEGAKDAAVYDEQNRKGSSQDLPNRQTAQNAIHPRNHYAVPWTRSDWLRLGYRPAPDSTNGRRLILALPKAAESRLGALIPDLARLSNHHDLEVQVLTEGAPDPLIRLHADALAAAPRLRLTRPARGLAAVRQAFLRGQQSRFERLAFVSDPARIDEALMSAADCVFVTLRPKPVAQGPARFGCTLVTSVFRSDPFIEGFLANSRALIGYGRMIEHVFLVSTLSETELVQFDALLAGQDSAVILWHRQDPGLYECWNIGIRIARTDYVSNANVDDLRDPDHVLALVQDLEANPDCLVAATALKFFTDYPADGSLPADRPSWYADRAGRFGLFDIAYLSDATPPVLVPHNMPHCMPVWRRSLHARFGWFDEPRYGTYADWAFWLRVLKSGGQGWMNKRALGFYFVNPTSHNRRGTDLDRLHRVVEADFIDLFLARRDRRPSPVPATAGLSRKLILRGKTQAFGQHRNSFNALLHALEPLEIDPAGDGGVLFIPFLERQFVWGDEPGEAGSSDPRPLDQPWIGILHVPFDAPAWFSESVRPESFMATELFRRSRPACRGIITLARDLEADLNRFDPGLPTLSVLHPTALQARLFDPQRYRAGPAVVQVGDWLRKLQAIHRLRAPGHRRVMLLKQFTRKHLMDDIAIFSDYRDPTVEILDFISNDRYDDLLSSAVVLCLLYGTAANNVVIECIARATPILINPLPAVVEYLGRDYPLYATDEAEADALLTRPGAVEAAHEYLLARRAELDLSYEGFCYNIGSSGFYASLPTPTRPAPAPIETLTQSMSAAVGSAEPVQDAVSSLAIPPEFKEQAQHILSLVADRQHAEAKTALEDFPREHRSALRSLASRTILFERELEWTAHGINRTFRFWSEARKKTYIAFVTELCRTLGERYEASLAFGTVLGIVRGNELIPHDDDADIIVLAQSDNPNAFKRELIEVHEYLVAAGFDVRGDNLGHRGVHRDGFHCDVFLGKREGEFVSWYPGPRRELRYHDVFPTQTVGFLDHPAQIPADPEAYLAVNYGPDWRTPDSNWTQNYDPKRYADWFWPKISPAD